MTEQTLGAPDRDVELLERVEEVATHLRREVEKRIVGQHHVIDGLLTALLANGHALLVGVPGLAVDPGETRNIFTTEHERSAEPVGELRAFFEEEARRMPGYEPAYRR